MKILYSSIEINKVLDDIKETRKYYITKDNTYGFEVTKIDNDELVEKEVLSMQNIANSEPMIKSLIDEVIKCEDDVEQAKYIVEDYMKQQLNVSLM